MGVGHRCFEAGGPKQSLNSADVVIGLLQVGSKGVAEGMSSDLFGDFSLADGVNRVKLINQFLLFCNHAK